MITSRLKVVTWGTRGSLPVAGAEFARYGGNTTCVEIRSECLGDRHLVIDAGSGFRPFSQSAMKAGLRELILLHTHYHHDHTQGALIAPPFYMGGDARGKGEIPITVIGPKEDGTGPRQVYQSLMVKPVHPMPFAMVAHHITFRELEVPSIQVLLFHPVGGVKSMEVSQFRRLRRAGKQMPFRANAKYDLGECLVVTMRQSEHPEKTVTYRFDEMPTGKSFVFLTDEECRAALPKDLREFIAGADLLIQDAQYSEEEYRTRTAGWGHGTPAYVVRVAVECQVKKAGLFHHDPNSTDDRVDQLRLEGMEAIPEGVSLELFACADSQVLEV